MELLGWGGREDMGQAAAGEKRDQTRLFAKSFEWVALSKGSPYTAKDLKSCFLEILHSFQVASSSVQRGLQPGALHSLHGAPQSREVCSRELCTTCR